MNAQQNLKTLLGEYVIQILTLQQQLYEANEKIIELNKKDTDVQNSTE